jgi:hypothetical protein
MDEVYQKKQVGERPPIGAPRCPECGARKWEAGRPGRSARSGDRHPQERVGWVQRGLGAFGVSVAAAAGLTAVAFLGGGTLPGWALWAAAVSAGAALMAGVVVADGLAVESKTCAVSCADCGEEFEIPWRPNA